MIFWYSIQASKWIGIFLFRFFILIKIELGLVSLVESVRIVFLFADIIHDEGQFLKIDHLEAIIIK